MARPIPFDAPVTTAMGFGIRQSCWHDAETEGTHQSLLPLCVTQKFLAGRRRASDHECPEGRTADAFLERERPACRDPYALYAHRARVERGQRWCAGTCIGAPRGRLARAHAGRVRCAN